MSPSAPEIVYSSTPRPTPITVSPSAQGFTYSRTPSPVYTQSSPSFDFEFQTSTPRPFAAQSSTFGNGPDTVYITPAPKTYVTNSFLPNQNYLQPELLPPSSYALQQPSYFGPNQFGHSPYQRNQFNNNVYNPQLQNSQFEIPRVQPLISNGISSLRPSAFDRVLRRYQK